MGERVGCYMGSGVQWPSRVTREVTTGSVASRRPHAHPMPTRYNKRFWHTTTKAVMGDIQAEVGGGGAPDPAW